MNSKYDKKRMGVGRSSSPHPTPYTLHPTPRCGISLMEVLASVFVIGVGLLGVLAVIPFGVYQVSKANHADYCSNMLRNAASEIKVRGLIEPKTWKNPVTVGTLERVSVQNNEMAGTVVYRKETGNVNPIDDYDELNCTRIFMVDPFSPAGTADPSNHIYQIGANFDRADIWQESMRGQDDILYTLTEDTRTILTKDDGMNSISSGKYTWFFTFQPEPDSSYSGPLNQVPITELKPLVSVDILACYNRSPGDPDKERTVDIIDTATYPYIDQLSGAQFTMHAGSVDALDVSRTKWIYVTWSLPLAVSPDLPVGGTWCQIVSAGQVLPDGTDYVRTVTAIVRNGPPLPTTYQTNMRAFIVDGILYHNRINGVEIK